VTEESIPVTIRILEKEYRVACKRGEQDTLFESAKLLDAKMREIRESGKVLGSDRIAVMAGLNLARELIQIDRLQKEAGAQSVSRRIRSMQRKIEQALDEIEELEILSDSG
jgi:cell division protein ZapA